MESSHLLKEISRIDEEAASVLKDANFSTDSDIQFLSREDLQELFPGNLELKRRKKIFDIIHKQKPVDLLLKEMRDFIPSESLKAALTGNGVLVDYLRILKSMKTQMDNVQTFLGAHINLLEDIKPEPNQELQNESKSTTSATTSPVELSNNQPYDSQQEADGSQLNTSTSGGPVEPDLNHPLGHQQVTFGSQSNTSASGGPVMLSKNQLPGYEQAHYGSNSTTSDTSGPMMLSNNQSYDYQQAPYGSKSTTSATSGPVMLSKNQLSDNQHAAYGSQSPNLAIAGQGKPYKNRSDPQRPLSSPLRSIASGEKGYYVSQTGNMFTKPSQPLQEVKYRMVVSGETFGAHEQLMDNIKAPSRDRKVQLVESSEDPQIIFVFCPIVSRLATDVNAALEDVKDSPEDASIILVLMHHAYEAKCVTHLRTWDENPNVALYVHVFYHERMRGLLNCRENKDVVSQIQSKLLQMHPCKYISNDAQDQSSMSGSLTGGGDNSGSQNDVDKNSDTKSSLRGWSPWWSGQKN